MNTQAHTPTPWEYAPTSAEDDRFDIYQANTGYTIARTVNNAHVDCRKANAELIVRAVNSHEALVQACKAALACLCMDSDSEEDYAPEIKQLHDALRKAGVE